MSSPRLEFLNGGKLVNILELKKFIFIDQYMNKSILLYIAKVLKKLHDAWWKRVSSFTT